MAKRVVKIVLVAIVILGMIVPLLFIRAAEPPSHAETLQEINGIIDDLIELKDNKTLSSEDKVQEEIRIRKEALIKITGLLSSETEGLQKKVGALADGDEPANRLRLQFTDFLEYAHSYAAELAEILSEKNTLGDLKEIARSFKTWRDEYYQPHLQVLVNFLLVADAQSILGIADQRLEKIVADLKKLESARITRRNDYNALLNKAIEALAYANLSSHKAKTLLYASLDTAFFSATSSTSTPSLASAADIKSFIEQSLNHIRTAYAAFLDISKLVKKRIGK